MTESVAKVKKVINLRRCEIHATSGKMLRLKATWRTLKSVSFAFCFGISKLLSQPSFSYRLNASHTPHFPRERDMETSLRYGNGDKQLLLHAKENFLLDKSFFLQVHGKLNTHTGAAHGIAQLKRKFFPELLTSLDIGAKFNSELKEFTYDIQGKKTLPVTDNGLLSVDIKGGYNFSPGSKKGTPRGVVELSYKVFNFTEDQDLKLKIGYNAFKQTPYMQIRENNWTLNHELNGGWNVIYDL